MFKLQNLFETLLLRSFLKLFTFSLQQDADTEEIAVPNQMDMYDKHIPNAHYEPVLSLIKLKYETMHIYECDINSSLIQIIKQTVANLQILRNL